MPPSGNLDSFIVATRPAPEALASSQEIRDRASVFVATIFSRNHLKHVVHAEKPASHELYAWRCMVVKPGCTGLAGPDEFTKWGGDKILGCMRKQGILDAVVIVSRWYGGTLLGPVRFTHIETCTLEVCREFKRQEDVKDALATLHTLDDMLAQLRDELAAAMQPSSSSRSTQPRAPDYSAWIDSDLPKAHRLIRARESAISNLKQLIAKHRQPKD
ncbi:hypothetical protein C8F01DRAFT_1206132 [Mycena amicta]|nr:hypothetical protein C8F01DRAFT_1206132 [Mycena amicta]